MKIKIISLCIILIIISIMMLQCEQSSNHPFTKNMLEYAWYYRYYINKMQPKLTEEEKIKMEHYIDKFPKAIFYPSLILQLKNDDIPLFDIIDVLGDDRLELESQLAKYNAKGSKMDKKTKTEKHIKIEDDAIQKGIDFYNENEKELIDAGKKYSVTPYVIVSILYIETKFGNITGDHSVLNSLFTAVIMGDKTSRPIVEAKLKRDIPKLDLSTYEDRINRRSKMLYSQFKALFEIKKNNKMNIFELKGSYAGAMGIPQFMPESYLKWAVDGNKDGKIDLYNVIDAVYSVANYLSSNGWENDNEKAQRAAIFHYNRSKPYGNYVMSYAKLLEEKVTKKKEE